MVQVPTAFEVTVPAAYVQEPAGLAETLIVTVPPDGATALTATVSSIPRSEKVLGVSTGSLANRDDDAAIVALEDGEERELSPTIFVATTFTV